MNGLEQMILIIGSGIAGLLAAQALQDAGLDVMVVDKGRGVGGRMATRRIGQGVFDHGAQFFAVRSERFARLVKTWEAIGLVTEWTRGFTNAQGIWQNDGNVRYRCVGGMTAVPKHLAQGLEVLSDVRVSAVERTIGGWQILTEDGDTLSSEKVIMTPPVPQSLDLLRAGQVELPQELWQTLTNIVYHPCIAVLALLDGPSAVPEPGAVQIDADPIRWIADNTRKGVSPAANALTIHGAPVFSRQHWDTDRTAAGEVLLEAAAHWLGDARVVEFQVHGWRYSQPVQTHSEMCLVVENSLVFAGDAFAGPRVEGAALSGLAAADALLG